MIKLVILIRLQYSLFLNAISLKKYVIKLLMDVFFVFDFIPDRHKTQEVCDSVVSEDPF